MDGPVWTSGGVQKRFQEGNFFGFTRLDNFDFYSKVTISVSHLDGGPWCLCFFDAFINLLLFTYQPVWTTGGYHVPF